MHIQKQQDSYQLPRLDQEQLLRAVSLAKTSNSVGEALMELTNDEAWLEYYNQHFHRDKSFLGTVISPSSANQ